MCDVWQDLSISCTALRISSWSALLAARDESQRCAWVSRPFFSLECQGFARAKREGRCCLNDQEHWSSKPALPALCGAGAAALPLACSPPEGCLGERSLAGTSLHAVVTFIVSSKEKQSFILSTKGMIFKEL